ncbi:MAG: energy-coupling factor transporter transmembrane protein EcfT [Firmicutes bacterium]|nr:energy-coupling factor transporter transmembrane protein EcfT [Bacillota bacterium]
MYLRHDEFTKYHPGTNFAYFCAVIILSLIIFHPLALGISLAGALVYAILLRGGKALKFFFSMPFIIMVLTVILNPIFVHKGITPLFYIGDSPVTKEAFIYGGCAALMIGSVMMWFYCYSQVMTSDRFMAVAGRVMPKSSLVFSRVLRFIPRLKNQAGKIRNARRNAGTNGEEVSKTKEAAGQMSMLTTWALENSIETSDAMRSRGYGLPGRTHYSGYKMQARDGVFIALIIIFVVTVIAGKITGALFFVAYPQVKIGLSEGGPGAYIAAYALLCFAPTFIEIAEELRWKQLESKI